MPPGKEDRIYRSTRLIAAIVVPFLVLAFIILYFTPERSGQYFAWEIRPNMTARFMGAGYLGGAWLFLNAIFGRRWHRISAGFLPVTAFTVVMLAATALHWGRFDLRHFPFLLWLGLYVVTPFLVPWMWLHNRGEDPAILETGDRLVPGWAQMSLRLLGIVLLGFALAGFIMPNWLSQAWVWTLTPLTARVLSGWFALLGVGGMVIARDSRWSAWKVGLESIAIWHALVLLAAALNPGDFTGGLLNWYLVSVAVVLLGMVGLFVRMERG